MISDEDDLIESNSSESSPPRDMPEEAELMQPIQQSDSNSNSNEEEEEEAEVEPVVVTFDKLFEKFIDANTSKSICKCFENMTNLLGIDSLDIFENG